MKQAPMLVDKRAAAELLSVSERTLSRLLTEGKIPSVKIGAARRVAVKDLEEYIRESRR